MLPLNDIAKFGPYVAVASALKTEGKCRYMYYIALTLHYVTFIN